MASALGPRGSTRAWRALRAQVERTLPQPCWRCGHTIHPTDAWQLGHVVDRADGGTDARLRPEHAACGSSAGARAQAHRARSAAAAAAGEWAPMVDEPAVFLRGVPARTPRPVSVSLPARLPAAAAARSRRIRAGGRRSAAVPPDPGPSRPW